MSPDKFECADVDGTFCIKWTTTEISEPKIVVTYWPTICMTLDVLRHFFNSTDLANLSQLACFRSRGSYFEYNVGILAECGHLIHSTGRNISLIHGMKTDSVKTETSDAPTPKNGECAWTDGEWTAKTKNGKTRHINPLKVQENHAWQS